MHHSLPILALTLGHISLRLRNVNMKAGVEFRGKASAAGKGLVAQSKRSVQPEKSFQQAAFGLLAAFEERPIFLDALIRNLRAFAIRDLVAKTTAHTGPSRGLRDAEQAAGHRAGAGMMVENGGRSIFDAVDKRHHSAQIHILQGENLIQPPPDTLQDLQEVARSSIFQSHSTSKRAVQMHVSVDQPWHDQPVARIHELRGRMPSLQISRRANLGNQTILDGDTTILNQGRPIILSNQAPISDQQHERCLRCAKITADECCPRCDLYHSMASASRTTIVSG